MAQSTIDRLIINSPYAEPERHWRYERATRTFELVEGRRPAGYVAAAGRGTRGEGQGTRDRELPGGTGGARMGGRWSGGIGGSACGAG